MNKQSIITILFTVLMSMTGAKVFAHDIEVKNADGVTIYYEWIKNNTELAVCYRGNYEYSYSNEYTGNVVIPESVDYLGNTYSVTAIKYDTFKDCSTVTAINIPNSVNSIGSGAFRNCSALTSVNIPNGVTAIGDLTFNGCRSLSSIVFPKSVTFIDTDDFENCSGLTSIIVEDGNPTYDSRDNCNALIETASGKLIKGCMNTIIPNTVTSIGYSAFSGCSGLTAITIPSSVTSIGDNPFKFCSSLVSIKVESGNKKYDSRNDCNAIIETASNNLIQGCMNTIIPNTVTSIGNLAFYSCSGLTAITIPSSVTSIGNNSFEYCSSLVSIKVESGNMQYDSRNDCNAIIETSSNTLICGIKSTVIPNSVTSIGNSAFYGCSDLTSIDIPNSVTSIGNSAFFGCSGLTSIDIPNNVTSIGEYSFSYCNGLTSIDIPNSVTSIGRSAFMECYNLASLTIGNSIASIGYYAFHNCPLTLIAIEADNPPLLGDYAFGNYAKTTLIVPAGTKDTYQSSAGWNIFQNVIENGEGGEIGQEFEFNGLRYKISEGNTVSVIKGGRTTSGDIVIPNQVNFAGIAYTVTSIGDEVFRDCQGINTAIIPNSLVSIGKRAFSGCINMKSVTIGNNVTSIGDAAFEYCWGLSSLTIPQSVSSIGIYAFSASHLSTIITKIENPFGIKENVFKEVPSSATLIVPKGSKDKYQAKGGWNRFTNIIEVSEEGSVFEVDGINYLIGYYNNNTVSVTSGTTYSGNVDIPDQVTAYGITYSVTSIEDYAFAECRGLTSVNIPNSVTSIGNYAFQNSGLTSLTIPKGVTTILASPFAGCNSLTSIKVDSENSKFDSRDDCNAIIYKSSNSLRDGCKTTIIPNSVTSILSQAFMNCKGLTSITIPDGLTSIGDNAFYGCSDLASLTIPDGVNYIGYRAFHGTAWYNSQPDGLLYLGKVFYGYKGEMPADTKITIKDGTKGIAGYAFYDYSNLTSITIPNGVSSIGGDAFYGCIGLKSITIPNSVGYIDMGAFRRCSALTSFTIPNSVTRINLPSILRDCSGLKSITIPNSVKDIHGGGLQGIALQGCNSLNCIISEIKDPFNIYSIFSCVPSDAKVIVPKGTKEAYRVTDGWSRFTNIIEVEDGDANGDEDVNQQDVNDVESFILGETPTVFVRNAADMNGDEKIDVVDIVLMQNIINKE